MSLRKLSSVHCLVLRTFQCSRASYLSLCQSTCRTISNRMWLFLWA
nr:MAG TPA: hypothetical protein [Caudoviricetes sp.]